MDPLSVATGCLSLLGAIGKTTLAVTDFIRGCREARGDLSAIHHELWDLQNILEHLKTDALATNEPEENIVPDTLKVQILSIITKCGEVVDKVQDVLDKHKGKLGPARWTVDGKKQVNTLRESLEAYKSFLNIALDMVTLTFAKATKEDTGVIRQDTMDIKRDTTQILEEIAQLRAMLPRDYANHGEPNPVLQQYIDNLTSYAESVRPDSPSESVRESLGTNEIARRTPSPVTEESFHHTQALQDQQPGAQQISQVDGTLPRSSSRSSIIDDYEGDGDLADPAAQTSTNSDERMQTSQPDDIRNDSCLGEPSSIDIDVLPALHYTSPILGASISRDGTRIALVHKSGRISIWNFDKQGSRDLVLGSTNKPMMEISPSLKSPTVKFSPYREDLIMLKASSSVQIRDVPSGDILLTLTDHTKYSFVDEYDYPVIAISNQHLKLFALLPHNRDITKSYYSQRFKNLGVEGRHIVLKGQNGRVRVVQPDLQKADKFTTLVATTMEDFENLDVRDIMISPGSQRVIAYCSKKNLPNSRVCWIWDFHMRQVRFVRMPELLPDPSKWWISRSLSAVCHSSSEYMCVTLLSEERSVVFRSTKLSPKMVCCAMKTKDWKPALINGSSSAEGSIVIVRPVPAPSAQKVSGGLRRYPVAEICIITLGEGLNVVP